MVIALTTCMGREEEGGGEGDVKEGARVKQASHYY